MVSGNPVDSFRAFLHYQEEHRLVAPGDSVRQDLVGTALTAEQHRVTTILRAHVTPADMEAFQHLREEAPGPYAITQRKREPQDFSASAIRHALQGPTPYLVRSGPTGVTSAADFPGQGQL